jgi:CDK-activating kinase assembly factor MAT1
MSRKLSSAVRQAGGSATVTMAATPTNSPDMCPVCKTIRYLNKDLEFLFNPECYHPMCSNCVNRLFNDGPNQCPYAGCSKTLRRKGFRAAFFGDLTVEREVDIRRRVSAVFNLAEDDFEDLRAYNDYLQKVEDLTQDLVGGTDGQRRRAEAELHEWQAEHRAEIERNRRVGVQADEVSRRKMDAEREAARQRRREAALLEEEERMAKAREREAELDGLAQAPAGSSAAKIVLKRRGQGRAAQLAQEAAAAAAAAAAVGARGLVDSGSDSGERLSIRGLKEKKKPVVSNEPYDPFGGVNLNPSRYKLRPSYKNDWLDDARHKTSHVAGGYDVDDYYSRSMFEAFAGLAVFIEDDKETGSGMSARSVATAGAGIAARQDGIVGV